MSLPGSATGRRKYGRSAPDLRLDWARDAWEAVSARPYTRRTTGTGKPLPSFCLKIPTGGGKTLLATRVIDLVHSKLLYRQTGLVLWIVPTTQIYRQTLIALKDRDHPYRQQLDLASAGRTLVLEKTSGFRPADVADSLCILMLMLPSANRETKEQLRDVPRQRRVRTGSFRGTTTPPGIAPCWSACRTWTPSRAAASGAGRSRPRSATPCGCCAR